ncbi:sigma-70 family RNA polymerase sigma factor [Alicyclobacillus sp. SO9]|uniref:sigma-70 family RNA polymerase sigma factor n=1 Tax=Alicyclobacillus sp. SO9 TaxID=2665646 RepID=UPI0018E8DE7F|nr:sigma-70 family RNA polymerase sigma factor [Alicyclobacillus sp. SO9]
MYIDEKAISAKTNDQDLQYVIKTMESELDWLVNKFIRQWPVERDEIKQWLRIEIWHAVKKFEPNKLSFPAYCRFVASNHIKARIRRYMYSKKSYANRTAIRLDTEEEEGTFEWVLTELPKAGSAESGFLRRTALSSVQQYLMNGDFTTLERDCLKLFYIHGYTYEEIQKILKLQSKKSIDNALRRGKKKIKCKPEMYNTYQELQVLPN